MNIIIDTNSKTITINEHTSLEDLSLFMTNNSFKDYSIISKFINYNYIPIQYSPYNIEPVINPYKVTC